MLLTLYIVVCSWAGVNGRRRWFECKSSMVINIYTKLKGAQSLFGMIRPRREKDSTCNDAGGDAANEFADSIHMITLFSRICPKLLSNNTKSIDSVVFLERCVYFFLGVLVIYFAYAPAIGVLSARRLPYH